MEKTEIKTVGLMLDCSRDAVYGIDTLKDYIDTLSAMGYNMLQLYTEDTYEVDGQPYFGYLRGRYTKEELKTIDDYAFSKGVELMPCIQTLAHLGGFARWREDMYDLNDILLADDDRTYELVDAMFKTCAECFRSRRINIGMDEAHMVGLGKYLDKHGYQNRTEILVKHLDRVCKIADKYGFKPMMWSDMFFRLACHGLYYSPETAEFPKKIVDMVPKNVELVYWDYYHDEKSNYDAMIKAHKKFNNNIIFAGGAWSWKGFVPNNAGSIVRHSAAISACCENGVEEIFITSWKDDGAECSLYSTLPALMHVAEAAKGNNDMKSIKEKFEKIVGISFDDFMAVDSPDILEEDTTWTNPTKYILYSDPFLGLFDRTVDEKKRVKFTEAKAKLAKAAKDKKYGYLFKTLVSLCEVTEVKYTLGVRTRKAYKAGDKTALKKIIENYKLAVEKVKAFYENFRYQWYKENKRFGFEKHSARIGGVMCRLDDCRRILEDYVNGKIDKIDLLEEEILPLNDNAVDGKTIIYGNYTSMAAIKYNW